MLLKDIAAAADMSASKTRMYLVSLLRTGLVSQNAASAYTLGLATLNLGMAAFRQVDLIDTTRSLMASLTQETQSPTLLSMWTGTSITIISRNDSLIDLPIDFRIGGKPLWSTRQPAMCSWPICRPRLPGLRWNKNWPIWAAGPRITLQGYGALAAPVIDSAQELRFVLTVLYRKTGDEQEAKLIKNLLSKIRDGLPTPFLRPEHTGA